MMKHTWLFEEGAWNAEGLYMDEKGKKYAVAGEWHISHEESLWNLSGYMKVLTSPPVEYNYIYEVEPFVNGRDHTRWFSNNPSLGEMLGNFILVNDVILSIYAIRTMGFTGTEHLKKVNDTTYHNRGALMKGNVKVLSWSVDLLK